MLEESVSSMRHGVFVGLLLVLILIQTILAGIGGVRASGGYAIGSDVSLLHIDLRGIEYIRYLGDGLMAIASAGLSKLFLINTSNGGIVAAVSLPRSGEIGDITYVGMYSDLLVVVGRYDTIVFYMNSSSENIYYLARHDDVSGYYGGEINGNIVVYDRSGYTIYDPVTGKITRRTVKDRLYDLCTSGDKIYGVRYRYSDYRYILSVWSLDDGSANYPIIISPYYNVYGLTVSPNGSLATFIVEKSDKYSLYIVNLDENTTSEAYTWSTFSLRRLVWLDDRDILIVKTYGFTVYRLGEGVVYDSGNDMILTWYIDGGYIVRGKNRLTLYAYEDGSIIEKTNLTLEEQEAIDRIQVVGGFIYNNRIYLAVDVWYRGSRSYASGVVCFDMNGDEIYSLLDGIETIYAAAVNGYVAELVYDWINGSRELWIIGEHGEFYNLSVYEGDFKFLFMMDKLICYEVVNSPMSNIYVYNYDTGELVYADTFRTVKDYTTYAILDNGDKVILGYYDLYNHTAYIVVFDKGDVYTTWNISTSLNDLIVEDKVYLVAPSRITMLDPFTGETTEITSEELREALGGGVDINLEAAALTDRGLFVQGYDAYSHDAVIALLNPSSLEVVDIKIINRPGYIVPIFHPIPIGNYVVTYMDGYVSVSVDSLQPIDIPGHFLTASGYTDYIYTLRSAETPGRYDELVLYNPDGSIAGYKKLPIPVETTSIAPNQVKATGKYLVFAANKEYIIVYDVFNDEFYTIYSGGTYNEPISTSSRLVLALPIGTLVIGKPIQPPQQETPGRTTTTTTTTTTIPTTTTTTTTTSPQTTTTTTRTTSTTTASTTTTTQQATQKTEQPGINYGVVIAIVVVIIAALGVFVFLKR